MMHSIRQRLLCGLLAGLGLVLAASGHVAYRQARTEVNALFDYQLQQTALALRNQNWLSLMFGEDDGDSDLLLQVWDRGRGLLYVSRRSAELPFAAQPGFTDLDWRKQSWRLFALYAGERIIQVAQPVQVRRRMSADIALRNLAPFLLLLPGMGLVVWFGVGAGLRPLRRIAEDLRQRRPDTLEPLASGQRAPLEIVPLVQALDALLARLAQTLDSQRQFIADAAHELRTPLTALYLQAELARRGTDADRAAALEALRAGLERIRHLVEQLLAMARLDATPPPTVLETVELRALARGVVAEQTAIAAARDLDLGLLPGATVSVAGNPAELRTLLSNLVDNALRYTPAGGQIDVGVDCEGAAAVLSVRDTGPGIAPAERARVFDRFYRGAAGTSVPGSGLGLAIVQHIADRHQARITLDDAAPGLRITVRFAQAAQTDA